MSPRSGDRDGAGRGRTKTTRFLPPGGANVSFVRFSTRDSMPSETLTDDVCAEKLSVAKTKVSWSDASALKMTDVLPTPTSPVTITWRFECMKLVSRYE